MKFSRGFALFFLLGVVVLAGRSMGGEVVNVESPQGPFAFVAEVGNGRVTASQVYEVWAPTWNEAVAYANRGKIGQAEFDSKLQKSWEESMETVIREEIFRQEAEREFDKKLKATIDRIYEMQKSRRGEIPKTRAAIARRVRQLHERSVRHYVDDRVNRLVKAAGGVVRLKKVISGRGITWNEWRERLKEKAFTQMYLNMFIGPKIQENPRPSDIRNYYKSHRDEFVEPGAVRFRHILFSYEKRGGEDAARLAASSVYEALTEKRMTFEEAAKKFSDDDKSRARGGLETALQADPEREAWLTYIREAVRSETPGELGTILVSPVGCHITMLIKALPGTPVPFRQAQKTITEKIVASRREEETQKLYKELRKSIRVRILMPRFPRSLAWASVVEGKKAKPSERSREIGPLQSVPGAVKQSGKPAGGNTDKSKSRY